MKQFKVGDTVKIVAVKHGMPDEEEYAPGQHPR
jgi:hypothetical protein